MELIKNKTVQQINHQNSQLELLDTFKSHSSSSLPLDILQRLQCPKGKLQAIYTHPFVIHVRPRDMRYQDSIL